MIDQIVRLLQHILHEPARLLLFNRIEYRSAIPGSEQSVEMLAILAEPMSAIHEEHSLFPADQVGCHGEVWSIRAPDALFIKYRRDGLVRVENDIARPQDVHGQNVP